MATISPENEHPVKAFGWAARDIWATGEKDVRLKVLYCGICHTDLHYARNDWGFSTYPLVPGHEIAGVVIEVGSKVTKCKVGDKVGVGCFVGSCGSCDDCSNDLENYCTKFILTYPGVYHDGTPTYGGYSDIMVADEHFMICFPENMPLDSVGTMDGIIDTVSAFHPIMPLIDLLRSHGKLIMVGAPEKPLELPVFPLLIGRKMVAGSCTGGLKETQEMIEFAAKHKITADIEVIPMDYVNKAMERLSKGDVKYRFVIDVANTLTAT
ncbi:hypothetical protein RJ639_042627 [Escallonia herrerae]|uniref:Uncharacterized protein n=1 Tax=Escallonia herrerae TaxID=1293975 RepID=A0AA89B4I4_9ASTE|nr:hypothetical protein RJ639_042627 [Escallonia herrerae]